MTVSRGNKKELWEVRYGTRNKYQQDGRELGEVKVTEKSLIKVWPIGLLRLEICIGWLLLYFVGYNQFLELQLSCKPTLLGEPLC